ncbi:DDB1- and CUL4-associated factor 4 isoform X2 [Spea bombifrons]|nr:DDB1- and CUL4-associated factor 4 isoform X2 [Spea bombifrons]
MPQNSISVPSPSSDAPQSSSAPELPGFYYDPEKNRYFRMLPGHNNCNPLTKELLQQKEMECKRLKMLEEEKTRKKSTRPGLNATMLVLKRNIGKVPVTTYCRFTHELKAACMRRKKVSIKYPEPVGGGAHRFEFILADSSNKRIFAVNDTENGFYRYGLVSLSGLWKDIPTVESHDNPHSTNHKVMSACWASLTAPDSHLLVCLLGKPQTQDSVSLIPTSLFRNVSSDYDHDYPEMLYNIKASNPWTCAWCANPQLANTYAAGLKEQILVMNAVTDYRRTFRTFSDTLAQQFATQTLLLYNGCRSGEVFSIDLRVPATPSNWKKAASFKHSSGVTSLRLLQDENYLIVADMSGEIKMWDVRMTKPVKHYEGHNNSYALLPLHVKEDEGLLLAVGQDCFTRIWNLQDTKLLRTIPSPHPAAKDSIPSVVFSHQLGGPRQMAPGLLMAVKSELYYFTYDSGTF